MSEYEEIEQVSDFKDKKTSLMVCGILQILLGSFCLMAVPMMIFGMIASKVSGQDGGQAVNIKMMIPSVLVYLALGAWLIVMGIGSIKARRWARSLILVVSWFWLICGVCGLIFMLQIIPKMFGQMPEGSEVGARFQIVMKVVMFGFMTFFYIVIPGVFVLCYKGRDVKATCEYRNRQPCWTDKCPLPVLSFSVMCTIWAVSMLSMIFCGGVIPFFGVILSGVSGSIVTLVLASLLGYAAWGMYKLDIRAWWCGLLVTVCWFISVLITFSSTNIGVYYEKMGFPAEQVETMSQQFGALWGSTMSVFMGLWVIAIVVYLMYIRKYFTDARQENDLSEIHSL